MCPLYSRHVSALILRHHQVIIKYFVNCCEKEGIIIYSLTRELIDNHSIQYTRIGAYRLRKVSLSATLV
jgi:hypothetical protein